PRQRCKSLDVFWEAAATEARTGVEELPPDALIHSHAFCDIANVGAEQVAQVRDFIDERDLSRKKCIRGVLYHFRRFRIGDHKWSFYQVQRAVEIFENLDPFFIATTDHHSIGPHEIVNRGAFAQELRIRRHRVPVIRSLILLYDRFDETGGPHRNGAL